MVNLTEAPSLSSLQGKGTLTINGRRKVAPVLWMASACAQEEHGCSSLLCHSFLRPEPSLCRTEAGCRQFPLPHPPIADDTLLYPQH